MTVTTCVKVKVNGNASPVVNIYIITDVSYSITTIQVEKRNTLVCLNEKRRITFSR